MIPHLRLRGLMLADQIFFSAANFVLTISVARMFSEDDFAALGVGLAFALAVQGAQKSLYIVPMSLMARDLAAYYRPSIVAEHLIFVCLAVLLTIVITGAAVMAGCSEQVRLIGLATLLCNLTYFQADFDRAMMLKLGRTGAPAGLSLSYLAMTGVLAFLAHAHAIGFVWFVCSLIGFSIAKGAAVLALVGVSPKWFNGYRLLNINFRRYGVPSLVGAASYAGFTQVPVVVLASVNGAGQIAVFVAMRSLMQPLMVIIRSLDAGDKNRFREASGATIQGIRRLFWRTMAIYAGFGVSAFAVLSIDPERLIGIVYKGKYTDHPELLFGWCIFAILSALTMPTQSVIYLLGRQHRFIWWNLGASSIGFVTALLTCGPWGADGAMLSTLLGSSLMIMGGIATIADTVIVRASGPLAVARSRLTGKSA